MGGFEGGFEFGEMDVVVWIRMEDRRRAGFGAFSGVPEECIVSWATC